MIDELGNFNKFLTILNNNLECKMYKKITDESESKQNTNFFFLGLSCHHIFKKICFCLSFLLMKLF